MNCYVSQSTLSPSDETLAAIVTNLNCLKMLNCEAQARVRQGSARDGSQGEGLKA